MEEAEARLPRWMMGLATVAVAAAIVSGHARFAAGFAIGAGLALLNYLWLHQAIEHLLAVRRERLPRRAIAKFALRYPLAFGAVYLFYRTGWVPIEGVLAGLFVPAGGVLVEAVLQIRDGLRTS